MLIVVYLLKGRARPLMVTRLYLHAVVLAVLALIHTIIGIAHQMEEFSLAMVWVCDGICLISIRHFQAGVDFQGAIVRIKIYFKTIITSADDGTVLVRRYGKDGATGDEYSFAMTAADAWKRLFWIST